MPSRPEPQTAAEVLERARETQRRMIAQRRAPPSKPKPIPIAVPAPMPPPSRPKPEPVFLNTVRLIVQIVARRRVIPVSQILNRNRTKGVMTARRAVIYVARSIGHSFPEIGRRLRLDHSTVCHGYYKAKQQAAYDQIYAAELDEIEIEFRRRWAEREQIAKGNT